jgi:hypothetical protein
LKFGQREVKFTLNLNSSRSREMKLRGRPIYLIVIVLFIFSLLLYSGWKIWELKKAEGILLKASKAMDKAKSYKVRITVKADGKIYKQFKEVSGKKLHWKDETRGEEQYYINGILYIKNKDGSWSEREVNWETEWYKANNLDRAKNIKLKKISLEKGKPIFVISYTLPSNFGGTLKATDYIDAFSYRYVKASTEGPGFMQKAEFYDYGKELEIKPPK